MRVVVTGALGYVGSRLVSEIAASRPSFDVVMIDNRSASHCARLSSLPECRRFQFIDADILNADLPRLFDGADVVIHLAALTNGAGADESARMQQVNIDGTSRVAAACIASGPALLFPSTTSVYGINGEAVVEDTAGDALKPQSRYAASKLHSEVLLRTLSGQKELRCAVLRMGTVFGASAGMSVHTAVNRFCGQAVAGEPIAVWQTAVSQVRPYLDVSDATRAMIFAVDQRCFDNRIYNVATENATAGEVLAVVAEFVDDVRVTHVASPLMNTLSYGVDTTRLTSMGFEFRGSLRSGIASSIAALRAAPAASTNGRRG